MLLTALSMDGLLKTVSIIEYEVDNTNELTPNAYDKIRYLRLVVINTFATYQYPATSGAWFIGEITPWGQVNK